MVDAAVQQLKCDRGRKAQQAAIGAAFLAADVIVAPINRPGAAGGEREKCGSAWRNGRWGESGRGAG